MKKRPDRRHALSVLLSFLAGFVALQAGVGWVVESGGIRVLDEEFHRHLCQAKKLREEAPDRPFLLTVGSSRLQLALDPETIEREEQGSSPLIYNCALQGFGLPQALISLRRFLDRDLRPDYLLLEINPGSVARDPQVFCHSQLERMTIREIQALAPYSRGNNWTLQELVAHRALPGHGLRNKVLLQAMPAWLPHHAVAREKPPLRPWGGSRVDLPAIREEVRQARTAHARTEYEDALRHFRIPVSSDALLREILSLCQRERIPTALLLAPEGPVFRGWYREGAREELLRWVQGLADAHQAEVMDTWTWCREEDFFDSHHLLAKSAPDFTRRLWHERIGPWLKKPVFRKSWENPY